VTLNQQAPAGGIVVSLSSSDSTVADVPATVTVPQWATSASFTVTTSAVAQMASVTITASSGGATQTVSLTVAPPTINTLTLDQSNISGGGGCTGMVGLSGPAPSGGAVVTLESSDPNTVSVPSTVTVPAGGTLAYFSVSTNPAAQSTTVTVSATYQGTRQTVNLTVSP